MSYEDTGERAVKNRISKRGYGAWTKKLAIIVDGLVKKMSRKAYRDVVKKRKQRARQRGPYQCAFLKWRPLRKLGRRETESREPRSL